LVLLQAGATAEQSALSPFLLAAVSVGRSLLSFGTNHLALYLYSSAVQGRQNTEYPTFGNTQNVIANGRATVLKLQVLTTCFLAMKK